MALSSNAQELQPKEKEVQEIAQQFIKLIFIQEYKEAKKISTPNTVKIIADMEEMSSKMTDEDFAKFEDQMHNMRKAQIKFSRFDFENKNKIETCKAFFTFSNRPEKVEEIVLEKTNGSWLVDMTDGPSNAPETAVETAKDAADAVRKAVEDAADAVEEAAEAIEDVIE